MNRFYGLLEKRWFANTAAGCVTVLVYLLLSHFGTVWKGLGTFVGFFSPLIGGCVIAYIANPVARLFERTVFRGVKKPGTQWMLSILLTVVAMLLVLSLLLMTLIPQLVESVTTFVGNLRGYAASVQAWIEGIGLNHAGTALDLQNLVESWEQILETVVSYISENSTKIISVSTSAGKGVFNWVIAFILSIYLLAAKKSLKSGALRLLRALMRPGRYEIVLGFLRRCDGILNRYVIFNLIDSLIVGVANAVFMSIAGMQYTGLVSMVVAATNLVPTFGPVVGAAVGAFVLVMVKPVHALIFLIFTVVLQLFDGYILKPRLFGNSLGVSGLWILVAVIVGGRMIGIVGILLAIPFVAILDHIYKESLLPALERRRARRDEALKERPKSGALDHGERNETNENRGNL